LYRGTDQVHRRKDSTSGKAALLRRSAPRRDIRVAIVGAGLGGIATAVKLTRAGFHNLTVFEKAGGPGGVWWQNTYPGCEVDVASLAYSFSFMPYDWTRTHAAQPELLRYARDVIAHFGLEDRVRYDTEVRSACWDDATRAYVVRTGDGSAETFDVVVSCVGMLSHPRLPGWPGMDRFAGPMFHTSRYEHDHDLRGLRVAIVGTGRPPASSHRRSWTASGTSTSTSASPGSCCPSG
jgi:cation diffusion facilitator CzcD-associated flavoprotein CzcO